MDEGYEKDLVHLADKPGAEKNRDMSLCQLYLLGEKVSQASYEGSNMHVVSRLGQVSIR